MSDTRYPVGASTANGTEAQAGSTFLFTGETLLLSGGMLVGGAILGALILLVASLFAPEDAPLQGMAVAEKLVGWRLTTAASLPYAVPDWVVFAVYNGIAVFLIATFGPLACAAEVGMRKRWPAYDKLCSFRRRRSFMARFYKPLALVPMGPAHDGLGAAALWAVLCVVANGVIIGIVLVAWDMLHPDLGVFGAFMQIAPHGLVEIPTLCMTCSVAFENVRFLAGPAVSGGDLPEAASGRFRDPAMARTLLLLLFLVVTAALIEGLATARITTAIFGGMI